jgi:hypothetical protein
MRKSAALLPIALALGAPIAFPGGAAQAQDARGEPIAIEKCQTISKPGSYVLANNLGLQLNPPCLIINVANVTLDLAGFQISVSGEPAILGKSGGIVVRNGSIAAFRTIGVDLSEAHGSIVEGLRISSSGSGIGISANGIVRGNTVTGDRLSAPGGAGIAATGTITNNYVSGLSFRVGIAVGAGSTVIGNTSINNGAGIDVSCPANLTDNTAVNNGTNLQLNGQGCNNTNNVAP